MCECEMVGKITFFDVCSNLYHSTVCKILSRKNKKNVKMTYKTAKI